ncbi:hypothetical protein C0Q70_13812 [Pomacea canaliculata]|uniref:Down syndrome cell adhesion molecule-like protein Dscam2 n=1 Tax=Pomacea canaliculata TaxID=400727 RepID=A0A2T7NYD3_POMCA|nr:hypothetical protein C0Q70_13812 [Pomacea canaliculata]
MFLQHRNQFPYKAQGPLFISHPPDTVEFANTRGASIPCTAFGRPAPVLEWVDEYGKAVVGVEELLQILPNNTLYFPPFQAGQFQPRVHQRTYRCTASNSAGKIISRNVTVRAVLVDQYRNYDVQLNDKWVIRGNTAVMRCLIFPTYVTAHVEVTGWTQSTKKIYPDPPAGGERPSIRETIPTLRVNEGESLELPCVSSQAYPVPNYIWTRDGIPVAVDNYHYRQLGGNLVIINSTVNDSGSYVCTATNTYGMDIATTVLTVYYTQMNEHRSHPINKMSWYKNGERLLNDSRLIIQSDSVLVVHDVRRQDQGMYQCFIGNQQETVQGAAQLSLGAAKPMIVEGFHELFVQRGQQVTLRCRFSGNPTPTVTWQLDGTSLPNDQRIATNSFTTGDGDVISYVNISRVDVPYGGEYWCFAVNNVGRAEHSARLNVYGGRVLPVNHLQRVVKGALIIETVQNEDTGQYTCTASNRDAQVVNRSVFVNVVEPPVIDPFSFQQRKQGDRIMLTCVISSGDLPITITWEKDGKPIPHDLGVMIQKHGDYSSMLSIADASPKHDGNYTCHANNAAASASYTAPLHVDVPPRWVVEPEDSFVVLHQTVQLDCQTAGTPDPEIVWRKAEDATSGNYQPVVLEGNSDHMVKLANGTLRIIKARESDHGYYLCHASNGIGIGISKVVFLRVHIPARFNEPRRNYTVLRAHNITMECQAVGDKPLSVSWSFNGQPVSTAHTRAKVVTQNTPRGALSQLTLSPALRNDTGFYTCNAKNKFGHGTLVSNLVVHEPPEAPSGLQVINVTSRTVTLKWEKPFDGNSPLLTYTVQYKNKSDVWQGVLANVTVPAHDPEATLTYLLSAFTYHIRVMANNSIGYSPTSEVVIATTLEEAPSGPPHDVTVKAIGSQALQVTWQAPGLGIRNGHILGYYIGYRETQSPAQFLYITKTTEPLEEDGVVLMHTIHNLKKFTEYTVHVKAYNSKGISPPSEDTTVFTLEDVPSQPPKNVQATPLSSRSIRVAWSPPPLYTLHGILQGYKVLYKPVRLDEDESDANFVTSSRLEVILYSLERYTNYSIQVLAYTRKGEGVRSDPIYVTTQQDVPEVPAAIKALAVNISSILVAWQPPVSPNGILTHYTVYYRNATSPGSEEQSRVVGAGVLHVLLVELTENVEHAFRVTASTVMGEVAARIASFPAVLTVPWHQPVLLPCLAVGQPKPVIQWTLRGQPIKTDNRFHVQDNGTLMIDGVIGVDAANYTCTASNDIGDNHISYMLRVQAPPHAPRLHLVLTTTSTIQVNWLSGSNGGSPIQGFVLSYKKEHNGWRSVRLGPTNRTYIAAGLMCGTQYRFTLHAFNRLGDSPDSAVVEAKTNGSGTCCSTFTVQDLHPATWYVMVVTAHSDAGSTDSELKFATLTYTGSTIEPIYVMHKQQVEFYQKVQVMLPLCGTIVVIMVGVVAIFLFCRRRKERLRYKETSSNLRRDITAETSLMNDLDKRMNTDLDSSSSTLPDHITKRNVNFLISMPSDDNLHANAHVFGEGTKTSGDNGSLGRCVGDDSNINPYATFNEVKQVDHAPEVRSVAPPQDFMEQLKSSEEEDDIAQQKAAAQREEKSRRYKKHPPPLPAPRKSTKGDGYHPSKEGYDNHGVILSPRRYASADHIHALFTQPPRPPSAYKSGSGSSDKGSQRHSLLSSVTTVSSSRDELLEALENAKRHPPPPVLYESQPESSSQPTDSSVATEPGIRQFTQSPPKPNEQREASCEVAVCPPEKRRRPARVELSSDTTECEGGELKERSPPRRVRGRHRGKQRGHVTSKRQLGTTFVPRRTSTTSSEEVTYSFGGERGSPGRPYSPALSIHRPPAYPADGYAYGGPIVPITKRGGRITPHAKLHSEVMLPPPSVEERRTMMSLAQAGLSSPAEEDERVSLLDRHYRPVPEEDSELEALPGAEGGADKGYTDDFTIV